LKSDLINPQAVSMCLQTNWAYMWAGHGAGNSIIEPHLTHRTDT